MSSVNIRMWVFLLINSITSCTSSTEEGGFLMSLEKKFSETIADIFQIEPVGGESARLISFDQSYAFNSTIALTFPIFTFIMPTDRKPAPGGEGTIDNPFGAFGFLTMFILGGLFLAIYTHGQGPNDNALNDATLRAFGGGGGQTDSEALNLVFRSIEGLSEMLDLESCTKLAICEAYAEPIKYGVWAMPLRLSIPIEREFDENKMTDYEKAASFGHKKQDECYYEYPCLVQPLDVIMYAKDIAKSYLKDYNR